MLGCVVIDVCRWCVCVWFWVFVRVSVVLFSVFFFFLMIRRPPRSTQSRSSAASDVYKRQDWAYTMDGGEIGELEYENFNAASAKITFQGRNVHPVSYTHLRAHETPEHLVCRLLLEKKKQNNDRKRFRVKKSRNKSANNEV